MIMQSTREATREELIQRINELQKENKFLRDENNICKNETVSKQVIRDKIEILEKLQGEFKNNDELRIKIISLKELLNKGE